MYLPEYPYEFGAATVHETAAKTTTAEKKFILNIFWVVQCSMAKTN